QRLNDSKPHIVIFTRSGGNVSVYVDGAEYASASGADTGARDPLDLLFGLSHDVEGAFNGWISEVAIYNGALTSAEAGAEYASIKSFYENSLPAPKPDEYVMPEDSVLFVTAALGVLVNDTDADGDTLTASLVDSPQHGDLSLKADGSFLYDPKPNFYGTDSFSYAAVDFRESEPVTVTIEVTPTRDAPIPQPDSYKLAPNQILRLPGLVGVLANDINRDDLQIEAQLVKAPSFGELALAADGGFVFDPNGNSGTTTFTYRIADGESTSPETEVTLVVNAAPTANADIYTVNEDETLIVSPRLGLTANDVDTDSANLTAFLQSEPQHGTLVVAENGAFTYEPDENYFGEDSFAYRITDGIDTSLPSTVTLRVQAVNDNPQATSDAYFTAVGARLDVDNARGVLANDVDVEDDSQSLTASVSQAPANGTINFESTGAFVYEPNEGFSGTDSFMYDVIDTDGGTSSTEVLLFVGDAPIRITEIMAANASTLLTRVREDVEDRFRGDDLSPDWVELHNQSNSPIDISGFHLTDVESNPTLWAFPAGTVIPAQGYEVVFLDRLSVNDRALDEAGHLHANLKLDAKGESIFLLSPDGVVLDQVEYPEQRADVSYALTAKGFVYQTVPTPGAANGEAGVTAINDPPTASVPAGYYSEEISVTLTTPDETATIRYTLDGSEPTAENGTIFKQPVAISKTALLRARAFSDGKLPSISRTYSYIFLDDVLKQPSDPEGFPRTWERAGAADYAVDPRVATDTESQYYSPLVRQALQSHDAISIVIDMESLFDRTTGIYTNPQQQGVQWERPASMELISSDGEIQFQINAGLRIQGGASRNPNRPKHNMRFLFKEQYGESKLEFPFFDDSVITTFDTMIMRGGNGDSWFHPNSLQQQQAQYIRDQWHKQTQQLMGHTFVPQRYMHLYLNGLYWGLYHVFEKPNAASFAERFGGQPEDYDVLQHQNGVVDGSRDKWQEIINTVRQDPESDATFEMVKQEVDVPDLMEYLLLNFYSGNVDWDQNNWFGGRRREDGKFIFFTWDAERTFLNNRDNRTTASNASQPTDLHRRLYRANAEYRMEFADTAHRLFFNDGLLTPENAAARWQGLADEIELPLTAESARWGDNKRPSRPYTVDGEWRRELDRILNSCIPQRTDTVLGQLRTINLYPDVVAPSFSQHGGEITDGLQLSMTAPEGVIYYSTDGSDVRLKGGAIASTAKVYGGEITVSTDTLVKARVLQNGEWSALNEAQFLLPSVPASEENLRVTEIHYNPAAASVDEIAAGFNDNDDFEFIELANIGDQPIDLTDVVLSEGDDGGVEFDFRLASVRRLAPGGVALVVENPHAFEHRYGSDLPVAGWWSGKLSNGGETITVSAQERIIQQFTYDDEWYSSTDGEGHSLEIVDRSEPNLDVWSTSVGWRASDLVGGTPGQLGNDERIPGDSNGDGIFNSSDLVLVFRAGEYEDGIAGNSTFEEGDWNGDGDFDTNDFVFAFRAGTYVGASIPLTLEVVAASREGARNQSRRVGR
ncbi:MAG: tandem-95 repeat protein, partial [Planctomycetales bacterium]|nr:tandem-95 repeat protein [Planctomycetales bacterium]